MAQNPQKSLNNQAIPSQPSPYSPEFDEAVVQCRRAAKDSIQQLQAKAAKADRSDMPTEEEVEWANKLVAERKQMGMDT
ncbi:hypothetical protein KVR01_008906 [Diaporthe batatas]|uniref:uncharacterized protein n=1 Tax=Diaporthe batatas TaxID=748121 RepID=UPI001D05B25D|nr:uncharacterized protein KVR01_008906 [Diaporthe batatas]KAG8160642.1 hypothetical protein KVR01_008906 [Diaporthe batatas]